MQEGREATKSRQAGTLIDRDASTLVLAFRQASRYSVVQSVSQTDRQTDRQSVTAPSQTDWLRVALCLYRRPECGGGVRA